MPTQNIAKFSSVKIRHYSKYRFTESLKTNAKVLFRLVY